MTTFSMQSSPEEQDKLERKKFRMLVKKSVVSRGFAPTLDISFKYAPVKEYGRQKVLELVNKFFDEELDNVGRLWIKFEDEL